MSQVKCEFIRRALRELMATDIDLSHYGSLVLDIRKTGALIISRGSEKYFYEDIGRVLKTYLL